MLEEEFVTLEIGKTKHIALVAHDGKKQELVDWCDRNKEILKGHFLCGTGTTAKLIAEKTGLPVKGFCSGPLGGDQQIGAKIVEGQIDFVILSRALRSHTTVSLISIGFVSRGEVIAARLVIEPFRSGGAEPFALASYRIIALPPAGTEMP